MNGTPVSVLMSSLGQPSSYCSMLGFPSSHIVCVWFLSFVLSGTAAPELHPLSSALFPDTLFSTVGGTVLSIQDEMENVFVWEHLQAYEGPSKGAWLGMTFNPKGTKKGTRFYPS